MYRHYDNQFDDTYSQVNPFRLRAQERYSPPSDNRYFAPPGELADAIRYRNDPTAMALTGTYENKFRLEQAGIPTQMSCAARGDRQIAVVDGRDNYATQVHDRIAPSKCKPSEPTTMMQQLAMTPDWILYVFIMLIGVVIFSCSVVSKLRQKIKKLKVRLSAIEPITLLS